MYSGLFAFATIPPPAYLGLLGTELLQGLLSRFTSG